jgi:hypothetical protein
MILMRLPLVISVSHILLICAIASSSIILAKHIAVFTLPLISNILLPP